MSPAFEELAGRTTQLGDLSLRRRVLPSLSTEVYEVKLGDEFLMSSLFTAAEIELARLGLAAVEGSDLDVVVGGLGLGYTARAVLEDERVGALTVIEALDDVIDWHRQGLLPEVAGLASDPRTRLLHGDFFALAAGAGFDPHGANRRFDAVLVDIDHTPRHHLDAGNAAFYTVEGLEALTRHLRPTGVFALWSDDPPDAAFESDLDAVFAWSRSQVVTFPNPITGGESTNTVYVARLG